MLNIASWFRRKSHDRFDPIPPVFDFTFPDVDAQDDETDFMTFFEDDPEALDADAGSFPTEGEKPIEMPPSVRIAEPKDEEALYAILVSLHGNNFMGKKYTPAKVLAQIQEGTQARGGIIGVIDGPDGTLSATVGLFHYEPWYSDEISLQELWLYVRPEARSRALYRDLFLFMQWVRQEYPLDILTSVVSRDRLPLKERIWSRFAEKIGSIYLVRGG